MWAFLLVTRLPAYMGPVAAGQPLPTFTTARADGMFARRDTRVLVISLEGLDDAQQTQADFPYLLVLADQGRGLSEAAGLIHPHTVLTNTGRLLRSRFKRWPGSYSSCR
jgi:hypothetical protein